jgi:hypothetical protein
MAIFVEPTLICDECDQRIAPDDVIINLWGGPFKRIENEAFQPPYVDIGPTTVDSYLHVECLLGFVQDAFARAQEELLLEALA